MPDDRLINRRMLRGDRIAALTDFERGVWLAYELLADDFGVMRFSATDLQKALWLERRPKKTVQRGFEAVAKTGLIYTFTDGQRTYCYQRDWQFWQHVRHPRSTIEPCPPLEELRQCDDRQPQSTQALFVLHPRCVTEFVLEYARRTAEVLREDSGNISEMLPQSSGSISPDSAPRARGQARMAKAIGKGGGSGLEGGPGETPHKVAFDGSRLRVWTWQHDDLARRIGTKDFDLLGWYPALNDELERTGESYGDPWRWLQERLYQDAGLELPNLMGRRSKALARATAGFLGDDS